VLAVILAMIFRKTLFAGESETFVMEMPPYHIPTLRSILTHMWERSVLYLKKAGTLILAASILIWFLTNYPSEVSYSKDYDQAKTQVEETFTAKVAESILIPMGLETLDDNAAFQAVVSQIDEIENQAQAEGATDESMKPEDMAAMATAKESKLAEIQLAQPEIYPFAILYRELDQQQKDEVTQLERDQAGEKLANSYAGQFGHMVEPVIRPLGFDWKIGVAIVSAVAAKEVLVSTLGTIYSAGDVAENATGLQNAMAADKAFTPLVAYTLMIFSLVYSPCLAALAVIKRETNSWKWTAFSFTYSTVLAYFIAFTIYQVGTLLGY
jgi:ferrous iron transport protein B